MSDTKLLDDIFQKHLVRHNVKVHANEAPAKNITQAALVKSEPAKNATSQA
jgi:hypothetical protein